MKNIAKYKRIFENAVVYKNNLWFVSLDTSWLCKMDMNSFIAEKVCEIPCAGEGTYRYEIASCVEGYIIIMPLFGEFVIGYDISDKRFEKWRVEACDNIKFRTALVYDYSTFLLPQATKEIVQFDYKNKKIIEYKNVFDELKEMKINAGAYFGRACMGKGSFWMPCMFTNGLFEFNINEKRGILHRIGNEKNVYEVCVCVDDKIYLVDNKQRLLVRYDIKSDMTERVCEFPKGFGIDEKLEHLSNAEYYKVYCMLTVDKDILLIPSCGNCFLTYNINSEKIDKLWDKAVGESYMSYAKMDDDSYFICSQKSNNNVLYNKNKGYEIKTIYTYAPFHDIVNEENLSLSEYIDVLIS